MDGWMDGWKEGVVEMRYVISDVRRKECVLCVLCMCVLVFAKGERNVKVVNKGERRDKGRGFIINSLHLIFAHSSFSTSSPPFLEYTIP